MQVTNKTFIVFSQKENLLHANTFLIQKKESYSGEISFFSILISSNVKNSLHIFIYKNNFLMLYNAPLFLVK